MAGISTVVMIGAGNVATHLSTELTIKGIKILQVYSRTQENAKILADKLGCGYTSDLTQLNSTAGIYIISVKDDAVAEVAAHISLPGKMLVHTGGALPTDALKKASEKYGVFYPLQTFTSNSGVNWQQIPICIEAADNEMLAQLEELASRISNVVVKTTYEQRTQLHVAAVFVNNFTNYMFAAAQKLTSGAGLPFQILQPLANETIRKAFSLGPQNAQTGPAKRADKKTIEKHLQLLEKFPQLKKIYSLISEAIMQENI